MSTTIVLAAAPQDRGAAPITLAVDATKTGPKIDRNLFGQFAEHLGKGIYEGVWVGPDSPIPNTRGIRNDVVAALKVLKVPNVRWPGGCFADDYHWRKGIGRDRQAQMNPDWGGVIEPNTFGTHEFMDFIDQIGSRAYLSVNVGSGSPQEAAEWLEYLTAAQPTALQKERAANGHPEPYMIPYLGIGNENWDCGGNMTPEYYLQQLKTFARYSRNFNPAQREGEQADAQDRRRPWRRRPAVDRVDRGHHEGLEGAPVELGHGRPLASQLHGRALSAEVSLGRVRRGRLRQDPSGRRRDGQHHHDALGDHGQVRSREEASRSSSTSGAPGTRRCRAARPVSSSSRTACATRSLPRCTSTSSRAMPIASAWPTSPR